MEEKKKSKYVIANRTNAQRYPKINLFRVTMREAVIE